MSENKEPETSVDVRRIADSPVILDKVDYVYVSYSQMLANTQDFRIAFGDRTPPDGAVKPILGLVMSHDHARALLKTLSINVPKIDLLLEKVKAMDSADQGENKVTET
jgi:hypothetical protein